MEPVTNQPANNTNTNTQSGSSRSNVPDFLKNKRVLVIAGAVFVLIAFLSLFLLPASKELSSTSTPPSPTTSVSVTQTAEPIKTVQMQRAIDEAKKEAAVYNTAQRKTIADYPWTRKLPIASPKYYIYFDLSKKVFIGKLYPQAGEDVEKIKTDSLKHMAEREVITTDYQITWQVYPQ